MADRAIDTDLDSRLAKVARHIEGGIDADMVRALLEQMLATMGGDIGRSDPGVIDEIESLSAFIEETKSQIAEIRPEEISDEHIPAATDELDAVVSATESATNSIMEAAELIEAVAEAVGGEHADKLSDAVTRIYEACSFQDITGQRIGKVIGALHEIENKIGDLIGVFGDDDATARAERRRARGIRREAKRQEALAEGDLVEGPQLPDAAVSQDDIDALFQSLR